MAISASLAASCASRSISRRFCSCSCASIFAFSSASFCVCAASRLIRSISRRAFSFAAALASLSASSCALRSAAACAFNLVSSSAFVRASLSLLCWSSCFFLATNASRAIRSCTRRAFSFASASLRALISAFQRIFSLDFSSAIRSASCFSCSALARVSASISSTVLNSSTTIGVKFDVKTQSSLDWVANGLIKPSISRSLSAPASSFSLNSLDCVRISSAFDLPSTKESSLSCLVDKPASAALRARKPLPVLL